jgi:hypothetical protein
VATPAHGMRDPYDSRLLSECRREPRHTKTRVAGSTTFVGLGIPIGATYLVATADAPASPDGHDAWQFVSTGGGSFSDSGTR